MVLVLKRHATHLVTMRYNASNISRLRFASASLLAFGLMLSACKPMEPSGDVKPKEGREKPTLPLTPADPKPGVKLSPLNIGVTITSQDNIFLTNVMPILEKSCAVNGCHSTPEVIDLRTFPFAAEGSYAMDDIKTRLGENPDPHSVQLELVKVLIDSMRTVYMPPAPIEPIEPEGIASFESWIARDLEQSVEQFQGKFYAVAKDIDGNEKCNCSGEIVNGSFRGNIERTECGDVVNASFQVSDNKGTIVFKGEIDGKVFQELETWQILKQL